MGAARSLAISERNHIGLDIKGAIEAGHGVQRGTERVSGAAIYAK